MQAVPYIIDAYLRGHVPAPLWPRIDIDATFEELRLDALAAVEMAMLIEEEFACPEVPEAVYSRWHTVRDVAAFHDAAMAHDPSIPVQHRCKAATPLVQG